MPANYYAQNLSADFFSAFGQGVHRKHKSPLTPCPRTSQEMVSKALCMIQLHLHVSKALIIVLFSFYLFSISCCCRKKIVFNKLSDHLEKKQVTFSQQFEFHSHATFI